MIASVAHVPPRVRRRRISPMFVLVSISCAASALGAQAAKPPLDADGVSVLAGMKEASSEQKADLVKRRCVSFTLDDAAELQLRRAGADETLLAAVKTACRKTVNGSAPATPAQSQAAQSGSRTSTSSKGGSAGKTSSANTTAPKLRTAAQVDSETNAHLADIRSAQSDAVSSAVSNNSGVLNDNDKARIAKNANTVAAGFALIEKFKGDREKDRAIKENDRRVDSVLAVRKARLEQEADIQGFETPVRPGRDAPVLESIGARLRSTGFSSPYFKVDKSSDEPSVSFRTMTPCGFLKRTWSPEDCPSGEYYMVPTAVYPTSVYPSRIISLAMHFVFPERKTTTPITVGCKLFGPDKAVLDSSFKEVALEKETKELFVSWDFFRPRWASGLYGYECYGEGKPIYNGTFEFVE